MIEHSESCKAMPRKAGHLNGRLVQPEGLNMMDEFVGRLRYRDLSGWTDRLAAGVRSWHLLLPATLSRHSAAACLFLLGKRGRRQGAGQYWRSTHQERKKQNTEFSSLLH